MTCTLKVKKFGNYGHSPEQFDFIYLPGGIEGLHPLEARLRISELFGTLRPGGQLLIAGTCGSSKPEDPVPFLPFRPIEQDVAWLSHQISQHDLAAQIIFRDESGKNIFLELHKRPAADG